MEEGCQEHRGARVANERRGRSLFAATKGVRTWSFVEPERHGRSFLTRPEDVKSFETVPSSDSSLSLFRTPFLTHSSHNGFQSLQYVQSYSWRKQTPPRSVLVHWPCSLSFRLDHQRCLSHSSITPILKQVGRYLVFWRDSRQLVRSDFVDHNTNASEALRLQFQDTRDRVPDEYTDIQVFGLFGDLSYKSH
jgi:hypothetical protein